MFLSYFSFVAGSSNADLRNYIFSVCVENSCLTYMNLFNYNLLSITFYCNILLFLLNMFLIKIDKSVKIK